MTKKAGRAELNNTFTIKITQHEDGEIELWSKGMPDTRSFGGQPLVDVPWSHKLGLFALGKLLDAIEAQGLTEKKASTP